MDTIATILFGVLVAYVAIGLIAGLAFVVAGVVRVQAAPVTIGAAATIGAGSTITRDAPAGKLTLARGRQVTVEGWQRPVRKPR